MRRHTPTTHYIVLYSWVPTFLGRCTSAAAIPHSASSSTSGPTTSTLPPNIYPTSSSSNIYQDCTSDPTPPIYAVSVFSITTYPTKNNPPPSTSTRPSQPQCPTFPDSSITVVNHHHRRMVTDFNSNRKSSSACSFELLGQPLMRAPYRPQQPGYGFPPQGQASHSPQPPYGYGTPPPQPQYGGYSQVRCLWVLLLQMGAYTE